MLDAGKLNQRVEFWRRTMDGNPAGLNPTPTTAKYAARWARVEQMAGDEAERQDSTRATSKYRITVRYFEGPTTADFLIYRGQRLDIQNITDPDQGRRRLVIEAVAHA
ncbi:MAG: phage head closure protein [Planctomycetota bacterium]